jgi:hypothetical protein
LRSQSPNRVGSNKRPPWRGPPHSDTFWNSNDSWGATYISSCSISSSSTTGVSPQAVFSTTISADNSDCGGGVIRALSAAVTASKQRRLLEYTVAIQYYSLDQLSQHRMSRVIHFCPTHNSGTPKQRTFRLGKHRCSVLDL